MSSLFFSSLPLTVFRKGDFSHPWSFRVCHLCDLTRHIQSF